MVYLLLMVKATMPSVLNIARDIFMRLYGSVEEVMTTCADKKCGGLVLISPAPFILPPTNHLSSSAPPPPLLFPPPPPKENFFFLDLDSLSEFTYWLTSCCCCVPILLTTFPTRTSAERIHSRGTGRRGTGRHASIQLAYWRAQKLDL